MNISRFYETTVEDRDLGRTVQFLSVPAKVLTREDHAPPSVLVSYLELNVLQSLPSPDSLPYAFEVLLETDNAAEASQRLNQLLNMPPEAILAEILPERLAFAQYLTDAQFVPFEASDPDLKSIMQVATATGVGAALGFAVVGTGGLLLFAAVPAGIILCYTAEGAGMWLRQKILSFGRSRGA
jgi:hypothetical protein